ncbi:serine hydrolase domain-containing protein [Nonomuraea rhizosphaerae]|uniref:serine hydrolase domain-containing protein n=1 Tax=Nonomuraea rhizosphaerae TaxID=2665663 RepID=UPI001C5D3526|nr:serine hydrolase domain-containing protein [Nonomuraea rhizosphaerae]
MLLRAAAGMLLLAATSVAAPATAGTGQAHLTTGGPLQELLDAEHTAGMPGLFAEVEDGNGTWRGAAGVADIGTARAVRPWFQHRVGSITKTFVATTVLQLSAEGRIRLDAPIGAYLPDLVPGGLGRQVSVRMLLNHTSGIGDYAKAVLRTADDLEALRRRTFTPRELVTIGLSLPSTSPPGAGYAYSSTNYIIAGLLIERVTGHPYAYEIGRRVLRPLGLTHTYFPGAETHIRRAHSAAYVPLADGSLRDFSVYNMSWGWAAGEMVSTPHDINQFYRALLSGRVLPPALLAEMKTIVPDPADPTAGYGLGLSYTALPCGPAWGHIGGVVGHGTFTFHSADGSRHLTLAENLTFPPGTSQPATIGKARVNVIISALCGP